jgi:hypothetical protein
MKEQKEMSPRIILAAPHLGITSEELQNTLTSMGIEESDLNDDAIFRFQDFKDALPDKPIASVRKAYRDLRGAKATGDDSSRIESLKALGYKTKLKDAPVAELLALYDPAKPSDPITAALRERFGAKAVIAFNDDGTIAIQDTANYMSDLEQGLPEAESIHVNGALTRLHPIGVKPDNYVDDDPLFPGNPLRHGYSTVNNRNWNPVHPRSRVMCRIIRDRGDINVDDKDAVLRLIEKASGGVTEPSLLPQSSSVPKSLQDAYPEAWMDYREKDQSNDLPKLRVKLGDIKRPNNPFGVNRKY